MNYFQFFDLPLSFLPDEAGLKQRFYAKSKRLHPDFYTLEPEEKQAEILEQSTYNNQAYKTLSDFDARMKYVLELKGAMPAEGQFSLSQDFLMEMMELNEELMELETEFDPGRHAEAIRMVEGLESELLDALMPILEAHDRDAGSVGLQPVIDYYFKKRYLLRIRENLNRFAG